MSLEIKNKKNITESLQLYVEGEVSKTTNSNRCDTILLLSCAYVVY